mgnify:CR=1 FL=1
MSNNIRQVLDITDKMFSSFSDKTKIEMHRNKFVINQKYLREISRWINENVKNPYFFEDITHILFTSNEDAVAFKLRWI